MDTKHLTVPKTESRLEHSDTFISRLYSQYLAHLDSQKDHHLLWFFLVLMVHGVFFLASPAILIGYYNAPVFVLAVTILNFFGNLIANMGGAGIRTTLTMFYIGLFINLMLILIYAF